MHTGTSLPVRECGLKSFYLLSFSEKSMSLPVRECGLKYDEVFELEDGSWVTPCAGVWIEIMELETLF